MQFPQRKVGTQFSGGDFSINPHWLPLVIFPSFYSLCSLLVTSLFSSGLRSYHRSVVTWELLWDNDKIIMPLYTAFTKCQTMGSLLLLQVLPTALTSTEDQHNQRNCVQLIKKNPKLKKVRNFQCSEYCWFKMPDFSRWYLTSLRYYKNRHVINKVFIKYFLFSQQ